MTKRKRKPRIKPRVRLSWAAKLHYLQSEIAVREMPARQRRDLLAECKAIQKRLIGECCTVVWFEDTWNSSEPEYPPPAENTPMRKCRCPACHKAGKFWPGQYIGVAGMSYECFIERHKRLWRMPGTVGNVVRRYDL